MSGRALVWLRRDLRAAESHALLHASGWGEGGCVACFVVTTEDWRDHDDAGIKVDFWLRNLREVRVALVRVNIPFVVMTAKKQTEIAMAPLRSRLDYPGPMVDHAAARARVTGAFRGSGGA